MLEAETRKLIDEKLEAAGWLIQDKNRLNLMQSLGVAVREMDTDTGPADYMLFIDGEACGINPQCHGTNVISIEEAHEVTPEYSGKSRFVLVDCVGVTETKSRINIKRAA